MDMFKIEGALKGYGLSDKEARLYIICATEIKSDETSINNIAHGFVFIIHLFIF